MPAKKTFEQRVRKRPSGCWEWVGQRRLGYGRIQIGDRLFSAHRVAWERKHGPIPAGLYALHKCDNRCCVNPAHLFLGTYADNAQDAARKGRHKNPRMPGESHPLAKLKNANVRRIRELVSRGATRSDVARRYRISLAQVARIVRRERWASLP